MWFRLVRVSLSGSGEQKRQLVLRMVVGGVVVVVEIDSGKMDTGAAFEGGEEGGGNVGADPVGHTIQLLAGKEGCAVVGLHRRRRRNRKLGDYGIMFTSSVVTCHFVSLMLMLMSFGAFVSFFE
ncbi:hypothetical protein FNV43_RR18116 [Rhamnella rubrinervis]|uniref:Uncharacterized protein n=1 Tax=Rhamnella rubrinervis TaxID=2594499 RepID=A0A8K0E332_9ROSA|nr:hypothetical protein FNV43_RR18116 [Rhamnella rubrinervis]